MLNGTCNQCGICCYISAYKCEHLEVGGIPGMPMATRCTIHDKRYTDMPIIMVSPHGEIKQAFCLHDAGPAEDDILKQLIRRGLCSLREE